MKTTTTLAFYTAAFTGLLTLSFLAPATAADFTGNLKGVSITDAQAANKAPNAAFTQTRSAEGGYTFDASGSSDSDGSITQYKWDFGDGTTATGATATHQFSVSPVPVTLTVIDDKGGAAVIQKQLYTTTFDIIADDADTTKFSTVGTWSTSTGLPGYYNTGYKTAPSGTGSSTATWTMDIPSDGKYEVFCYYTAYSNRASNAPFTIINNGAAVAKVAVNQQINGKIFFTLGQYTLIQGQLQITLSNAANGYVIADAVKVTHIP